MAAVARIQNSALALHRLCYNRNRGSILSFEMLWGVGSPFVSATILLPAFLDSLHFPHAWIGMAPAVQSGLMALTQPLSAYALPGGKHRLRQLRLSYAAGTIGYLLLGLLALRGSAPPGLILMATLLATVSLATGIGFGDPHYAALVVSSVPEHQRGRYFGLRAIAFGAGGILGGLLCRQVLSLAPAPHNYGLVFIVGAAIISGSTFSLCLYRDNPGDASERAPSFFHFFKGRLWPLIRDRHYRRFLLALLFFGFAMSAFPFLSPFIKNKLHETDGFIGVLSALSMGCNLVMSIILGVACDRWGAKRGFVLGFLLYSLGLLGCLLLHDRAGLLVAFVLAAIWLPTLIIVVANLAIDLAPGRPIHEVMAIKTLIVATTQFIGPILQGTLIDLWSMQAGLIFCLCSAACGLAALRRSAPATLAKA